MYLYFLNMMLRKKGISEIGSIVKQEEKGKLLRSSQEGFDMYVMSIIHWK